MANEYIRKSYNGGVIRTTTSAPLVPTDTTVSLTDGSSFPSTSFVIVIDRGLATEEKVLVSSRSSNSLTVLQRGYDGSAATSHITGAYVEHVVDSYTLDQANAMSTTMTTAGDIIYKTVTGQNTSFGRVGIGSSELVLKSTGSSPTWGVVTSTGIGTGAVGTTQLASTAVTEAKLATSVAGDGLVGGAGTPLALDLVTSGGLELTGTTPAKQLQIKAASVTNAMLATDSVNTTQIVSGAVTSDKILDGTILNIDVNASAAIAYSKLNLANSIDAADIKAAQITVAKLATTAGEPAGAWQSFTITNNALFTNVSNGDVSGAYLKMGKTLFFRMEVTSGTVTATGNIRLPLPFTADATFPQGVHGWNAATPLTARTVQGAAEVIVYGDSTGGNFTGNVSLLSVRINGVIEVQ